MVVKCGTYDWRQYVQLLCDGGPPHLAFKVLQSVAKTRGSFTSSYDATRAFEGVHLIAKTFPSLETTTEVQLAKDTLFRICAMSIVEDEEAGEEAEEGAEEEEEGEGAEEEEGAEEQEGEKEEGEKEGRKRQLRMFRMAFR